MRNRTPEGVPKTTVQVAIAACYIIVWAWSPFFVQAQAPACPEARPSEDELTQIRNAGRWLALYEIVCNRTDDALAAAGASIERGPCLAQRTGAGWSVTYGQWRNEGFEQRAVVRLNSSREVTDVDTTASTVREGWAYEFERAASVGRSEAQNKLGALTESHAYGVIVAAYPWHDTVLTTYVFPDPENETVLGGDVRVEVDADTGSILGSQRLHNEVIPMSGSPQNARASVSTAVRTCVPTETDVFMVLRREPRIPHIVVAEAWIYGIEPNGEVKVLRRREE